MLKAKAAKLSQAKPRQPRVWQGQSDEGLSTLKFPAIKKNLCGIQILCCWHDWTLDTEHLTPGFTLSTTPSTQCSVMHSPVHYRIPALHSTVHLIYSHTVPNSVTALLHTVPSTRSLTFLPECFSAWVWGRNERSSRTILLLLTRLEGAARYAGLLLAPAEGFGQKIAFYTFCVPNFGRFWWSVVTLVTFKKNIYQKYQIK